MRHAAILLLALPAAALAADADPFDPSGALTHASGTLQGESPFLAGEGLAFGVYGSLAEGLAVTEYADGHQEPVLGEAFSTTVYGGYTLGDRVRIDVFVPIYPFVQASRPGSDAVFSGAAVGDVRLQALVPVAQASDAFQFAIRPTIGAPTGTRDALVSRGIHTGLTAVLGGEVEAGVGWLANVGFTGAPVDTLGDVGMGSTVDTLLGGYWRIDPTFRVGAEADLSVGLTSGDADRANSRSTGHLFAQAVSPLGVGLTVGAGTGLWSGVGAPDYRMFAALTYGPIHADKDGDGILDRDDACPTEPEDFDDFEDADGCPEADNDADTIPDVDDLCPMEPEDFDDFEDADGCPEPDNDGDTVLDADDACPLEPGDPEHDGCPDTDGDDIVDSDDACPEEPGPEATGGCPDRDGDLVPDFRDACPDEPIPADEDPEASDGCPKRVYVTTREIRINEQVLFDSGRSSIQSSSHSLLDEVATILLDNPRIQKVEIAGHTDSQGSDSFNLQLSQDRAEAVLDHLAAQGVERARLTAKGYGETEPIDSNRTATGRANNRRVVFTILEQGGAGE